MPSKSKEFALSHDSGCTDGEVVEQLNRILADKLFHGSAVLRKFLRYIVVEKLRGNAGTLKEYTIGTHALGKQGDFNPQEDAVVRIHAGRLRRALDEYYRSEGSEDPLVIKIPKGSYIPIFVDRRTYLADLTELPSSASDLRRAKLSLAVLPFRNLGSDSSYQFFADGFGEELTSLFSEFRDIAVLAHHSARRFGGPEYSLQTIGTELGADYLILGSIRRTEEDIRISVGLAETLGGMQVWSKRYHYTHGQSEFFDIQDQIVLDVYAVLGGYYGLIIRDAALTMTSMKAPRLQALDAVLWNYYFNLNFSEKAFTESKTALEASLREDPAYAKGMAILSELYIDGQTLGYPSVANALEVAYEMAKKAVEMEPNCHHCQRSYGWANIYLKRKKEAMIAMERCLQLSPFSASTTGTVGFGMTCIGEYKRGFELLSSAECLTPHCPWWFYLGYFFVYFHAGNYEKALGAAEKITPSDVFFRPLTRAAAKGKLGWIPEAEDDMCELKTDFAEIMQDLRAHVGAFVLDEALIDEILEGIAALDSLLILKS